jgi:ADP-ribose pyrophosphatase
MFKMNNDKNHESTISSEMIYEGKVIKLQVDEVRLPNGKTTKREIIKHPGAVAILPITNDGSIIFVEQFRKALERSLLEIPAGKMEKGEAPETTARRELEEETGYDCEKLVHLVSFYTSPGFADEIVHLYMAEGLKKAAGLNQADDDEFVEVKKLTLEQAKESVITKEIYDAKTLYAVQYIELQRALEVK